MDEMSDSQAQIFALETAGSGIRCMAIIVNLKRMDGVSCLHNSL